VEKTHATTVGPKGRNVGFTLRTVGARLYILVVLVLGVAHGAQRRRSVVPRNANPGAGKPLVVHPLGIFFLIQGDLGSDPWAGAGGVGITADEETAAPPFC
jgi:hypothetical protein